MQVFDEGRHPGEFLLSEANGHRSRGVGTIKSGAGKIAPGTVLGKITADGKYIPSPPAEVVGSEGADKAVAVNLHGVDATTADVKVTLIMRDAEINGSTLSYAAAVDTGPERVAKASQLADMGIIVR